jgi:hypothetical protein
MADYAKAVYEVMHMADEGFYLSTLKGLRLAVAKRLINQGKLSSTYIERKGDWLVNKN